MADIDKLFIEITIDSLGRGYSGMTDQEVADDLNTVYRTQNRDSMSGSEIWTATDPTEYNALTDAEKQQWLSFCGIESHDPFGNSAQFVTDLFGGGSTTVTTLQGMRVENVSRAVEEEIGFVRPGNVAEARG
jgi:hypothetical protein